jgi:hypothetical protein
MSRPKRYPDIIRPAPATVAKYGMTLEDWEALLIEQGGVCGCCGQPPKNGRLVTDHEHVAGWKTMGPEDRKKYVRGLCDVACNHWVLTRYATADRHRGAAAYLDRYQARRDAND